MSYLQPLSKHENTHRNTVFRSATKERTSRTQVPTLPLTLYDMRVVLQEEVVQVFGNEGRHAGICQCCNDKKNASRMLDIRDSTGYSRAFN